MSANMNAQKILKELKFDFTTFTMDDFLFHVSAVKGREIFTIPWDMPPTLFGAWISDGDEAREYIFYRKNVSEAHQVHIQLHELSHFLFGHPTRQINREIIAEVAAGRASLPFAELPQLRSPRLADLETEAEVLASLIQKQAIQNFKLDLLIHNTAPEERLSDFMKRMGL